MNAGIETLKQVEEKHIRAVLVAVDFNFSQAAKALGIGRATLYRKANAYGITRASGQSAA